MSPKINHNTKNPTLTIGPLNGLSGLNIDINQKSKPTIASTDLQYTASTHDHTQTLELKLTPDKVRPRAIANTADLERDFPVEVMAPDSLNNTPTLTHSPSTARLVRTYSETETTNFNSTTGERIFDDMKHRPYHGFPSTRRVSFNQKGPQVYGINNNTDKAHLSYVNYTSILAEGIEDEYVPDFKFGNKLLDKWFDEDDVDVYSYDLNTIKKKKLKLHTELTPISVPTQAKEPSSLSKIDLTSLQSLPDNFKDLPFSQRKKILQNIYPNYSYTELTSLIKNYVRTSSNTSLSRLSAKSSSSSILASYLSNLRTTSLSEQNLEYDTNKKGAIVMNHRLLDVIGRGAWGVIRECKDLSTGELRAVKIISIQNEHVRRIFMNEINIWSMLHHENILPLLVSKETKKNLFAIMQLNYGGSLFELVFKWGFVRDHRISTQERESRTLKIVRQILQGLRYMHQEISLIHGDIKLENILIDANDKIMICDFGMAKFIHPQRPPMKKVKSDQIIRPTAKKLSHSKFLDDSTLSITALNKLGPSLASTTLKPASNDTTAKIPDNHIGSLPYASPELLSPEVQSSTKQDVWAMGVLIFTMLVGELPFKHDYEPRLRMMILKGTYEKSALEEEYGSDSVLVKAVEGCLQKDLKQRWSIDDLVDRLCR